MSVAFPSAGSCSERPFPSPFQQVVNDRSNVYHVTVFLNVYGTFIGVHHLFHADLFFGYADKGMQAVILTVQIHCLFPVNVAGGVGTGKDSPGKITLTGIK